MISSFLSSTIQLVLGTLYPAYASYKAVRTKNVREYVKWMMYWIVFAFFTSIESFADVFVAFWFPFYYEMKILVLLWLLSPVSRGSLGSSLIYRKFVHPQLCKREEEIDRMLERAQEQGYNTILDMARKAVNYFGNVVMQTAMRVPSTVVRMATVVPPIAAGNSEARPIIYTSFSLPSMDEFSLSFDHNSVDTDIENYEAIRVSSRSKSVSRETISVDPSPESEKKLKPSLVSRTSGWAEVLSSDGEEEVDVASTPNAARERRPRLAKTKANVLITSSNKKTKKKIKKITFSDLTDSDETDEI